MNSKNKIQNYIQCFLLIISFIACFFHTFSWLDYRYSQVDSYYAHGYFVPFISAWLIYLKWDQLKNIKISSNIFGLVLILFALLIHIIAVMSDINFVSGFAIFFYLAGSVLYLYGTAAFKMVIFPILFLLFMFPVPGQFIDIIGLPTKTLATALGLKIIDLIGIPNYQEGFRIILPETIMYVGTPCNGMKSLISFFAMGLLAAYITNLSLWKKIFVVIGVYPLAVVLNGCRIAMLIFIADNYGIKKASPESYLHDLSGIIVFAAGLIIIFFTINFWKPKTEKNNNE